jgi:DNA-binding transcriptional regulator YiaG
MSTNSELRARLERLGPVRVVNRPRLSSEDAEPVLLVRHGPLDKPVTVAVRLADSGAGLKGGHGAVTKLAADGHTVCVVSRHTDFAALAHELRSMNVHLYRRRCTTDPAAFLTAVRERHKLSQREFAERLGLDVRTMQNWEQGRNRPDDAVLALIRLFDGDPGSVQQAIFAPVAETA